MGEMPTPNNTGSAYAYGNLVSEYLWSSSPFHG